MSIKLGQVGYNVSVNQNYVAAWQALLWDLKNASKSVAEILAEAHTTDAFKVLLAANTTYQTANDVSTALTTTYFNDSATGKYSEEEAARTAIATNATLQLTALTAYISAWLTVINCATKNSGDKEVFYNFVSNDMNLFLSAFNTLVDALDDAYTQFKGLTDTTQKYTDTSLATMATTTIPASAAALGTISQKMYRAAADLQAAILITSATETIAIPTQVNVAKAVAVLTTITTASSGSIALFETANTAVFTGLNTAIA
jgi:hypothetical protein